MESGSGLAAAAVEAAGNRVRGAGGDVPQAQVGSHLPSLPARAPDGQQPVQHLLEQPVPSHLQASGTKPSSILLQIIHSNDIANLPSN